MQCLDRRKKHAFFENFCTKLGAFRDDPGATGDAEVLGLLSKVFQGPTYAIWRRRNYPDVIQMFVAREKRNNRHYRLQDQENGKQDGRIPPAYFSQEYENFDQHLPTVKNETTV